MTNAAKAKQNEIIAENIPITSTATRPTNFSTILWMIPTDYTVFFSHCLAQSWNNRLATAQDCDRDTGICDDNTWGEAVTS